MGESGGKIEFRYLDEVESFLAMHMENGYLGYRFSGIEGHPWDDRPFLSSFFPYISPISRVKELGKFNGSRLWIFN